MPRPLRRRVWFKTQVPDDYTIWLDRQAFLTAMIDEAPLVLESLLGRLFRPWLEAYVTLAQAYMGSWLSLLEASPANTGLEAIRGALIQWADEHHLHTPWILDVAVKTLIQSVRAPELLSDLSLAPLVIPITSVEKSGGPRARNPHAAGWLVRWQVLGQSAQAIAEEDDRRRKSFFDAKKAYENVPSLATEEEKFAIADRLSKAVVATLREQDLAAISRIRPAPGERFIAQIPALLAAVDEAAAASLRLEPADGRHTPWSTIDRAVRQYAKGIGLPLRAHKRGRRPSQRARAVP